MQGGPKNKKPDDLVKSILEKAAQYDSYFVIFLKMQRGGVHSDEPKGRKLTEETSEDAENVARHLIFWRNGFSIDDGPLFEYNDPKNQKYLEAINSGSVQLFCWYLWYHF